MARRSGPSSAVSCISRPFRAFNGRPRLLYRARLSRRDRTRARASLQRRFRAGMRQSVLIHASREQHHVCSGSVFEPQLVESLDLEVGEDAARAALSSRTSCSGACCAGKHHQSTLSSIQRHRRVPIRHPVLRFFRISSGLRRAFYKRSSMVHVPQDGSCTNEARCARRWTVRHEMWKNPCS